MFILFLARPQLQLQRRHRRCRQAAFRHHPVATVLIRRLLSAGRMLAGRQTMCWMLTGRSGQGMLLLHLGELKLWGLMLSALTGVRRISLIPVTLILSRQVINWHRAITPSIGI